MEVLVVDDDPDVLALVQFSLEREGFDVVASDSGTRAIALVDAHRPDLAILDVRLPDMSGLDLLAELRRRDPDIHVMMLSGAASEADRVLGLMSGADDYIVKPFSPLELAARVLALARRWGKMPTPSIDPGLRAATSHSTGRPPAGSREATVVITGTTIVYADAATIEIVGARRIDDVIGRDMFEFVAPRSIGATQARYENARSGRWPRPELITLLRVDGREVVVELSSAPVIWDGEPSSRIAMCTLDGSSSRLQQLVTGIGTDVEDAVIIADAESRIQSFNAAAGALYGLRDDEVLGHPMAESIPWVSAEELASADATLARQGHWHGEVLQRTHDGNAVLVRSSTLLLRDGAGGPVGVVSVNRPITNDGVTAADVSTDLDEGIRNAVTSGELVVHYQPVVWLDDGAIGGVEALVRWQHPVRGLLSPAEFVPEAERSGGIIDIGRVVLRHACEQARRWREQGHDLHVAVNLSARQLTDDKLVVDLAAIMRETATPPDRLWLEVTETSLVNDLDMATAVLQQLDTIGARVAIDDFGTGWASLTYLREFTVHALKIDRGFVRGLGTGTRDDAIVSSTISLARELDIAVIAEGIESEVQRSRLRDLGCVIGQGYLFGRPAPADTIDLDRARSMI